MKAKSLVIFGALWFALASCKHEKSNDQDQADCKQFNRQGVDSLTSYQLHLQKNRSTLEASLKLLNQAIKCDSNLNVARSNKIPVFAQLGEYDSIIMIVDDLLKRKYDSSILMFKAGAYDNLKNTESSQRTYKKTYEYIVRKLKESPDNANLIYYKILTMSKISKEERALEEVHYYLTKYPNDKHLKALLGDTITLKFLKVKR